MRVTPLPQLSQRQTATATAEVDDPYVPDAVNPPPPPSISTTIERIAHYLHVYDDEWSFPTSLVFEAPPSRDSLNFTPRTAEELRYPNSTFHLSLQDQESSQVVGCECFLNQALQILESHTVPARDPVAAQITESFNKALDMLVTLDKQKGAEWDRQVRAQRSPGTYVLTGGRAPLLPHIISHRIM